MEKIFDFIKDQIQDVKKSELNKLSCEDFLERAEPYFELDAVKEKIKPFWNDLDSEERWILIFLYRKCPECIDEEFKNSLFNEFCTTIVESSDKFESFNIQCDNAIIKHHYDEKTKEILLAKLASIAYTHKEYVLKKLVSKLKNELQPKVAHEGIYIKAFNAQRKKRKFNLQKFYDDNKLFDEEGIKYESFRKGYHRWKEKNTGRIIDKWPTDEFIKFFAMLNTFYEKHGEYYDRIDDARKNGPEMLFAWKSATTKFIGHMKDLYQLRVEELSNEFNGLDESDEKYNDKIQEIRKKIRRLVNLNSEHALVFAIKNKSLFGDDNDKIHAALMKLVVNQDGENLIMRHKQKWNPYFDLPVLLPCKNFSRIKTSEPIFEGDHGVILPGNEVVGLDVYLNTKDLTSKSNEFFWYRRHKKNNKDKGVGLYSFKNPSPSTIDLIMANNEFLLKIKLIFSNKNFLEITPYPAFRIGDPLLNTTTPDYDIKTIQNFSNELKRFIQLTTPLPQAISHFAETLDGAIDSFLNFQITPESQSASSEDQKKLPAKSSKA